MFRHVQESPLSPSVVPRACASSVTENAQRFWTKSKSGTRKSCFSFDSANAIKLNNGVRLSVQRVTTVTNAGSYRLHYAGEIWKRCFHSENASNVFRPHNTREIWKLNNRNNFLFVFVGHTDMEITRLSRCDCLPQEQSCWTHPEATILVADRWPKGSQPLGSRMNSTW